MSKNRENCLSGEGGLKSKRCLVNAPIALSSGRRQQPTREDCEWLECDFGFGKKGIRSPLCDTHPDAGLLLAGSYTPSASSQIPDAPRLPVLAIFAGYRRSADGSRSPYLARPPWRICSKTEVLKSEKVLRSLEKSQEI